MINLETIKANVQDEMIDSYVESYLEIYNQLEFIEIEWIEGKVEDEEYDMILDMCEFLSEKIAQHYISNYHNHN